MTADTIDTTKLWDLIKDIRFAMFTARHGDGQLHSRPMTTQNGSSERGGVLWFFMSRSGQPVADLEEHPEVNVTYSDPGKDSYVSISGAARVVEDFERKKAMWNTARPGVVPGRPDRPRPGAGRRPGRRGRILGREVQPGCPDLQDGQSRHHRQAAQGHGRASPGAHVGM